MRRRIKSPFHGAAKEDLEDLRTAAVAYSLWFDALARGDYQVQPDYPYNKPSLGRMQWRYGVDKRFWDKALSKIYQRADHPQIIEGIKLARMRKYDRAAYEMYMLRQEVAEIKNCERH